MNITSDVEAKSPDEDPVAGLVGVDGPVFSSLSLIAFWSAYINLSNSNADRLCPLGIYKSIIFFCEWFRALVFINLIHVL